jgi:hypothetical protein
MRRWARRRAEGSRAVWHWLAPPEREGGVLKTVCGHVFNGPDREIDREYTDSVPATGRCPDCQTEYWRVIRHPVMDRRLG